MTVTADSSDLLEELPPLPNPAPEAPGWVPDRGVRHPTGGYFSLDKARVHLDVTSYYDENSAPHREDGPAVEGPRTRSWFVHGRRHRTDGPAVEDLRIGGAREEWWIEGALHRLDGPSVTFHDGTTEYHVHGEIYSYDEYVLLREALDSGAPLEWAVAYAMAGRS